MTGRSVLITGANTGIGAVTARELAARGADCVLACRTPARAEAILSTIREAGGRARLLPLDLGDFASVRACAEAFLALERPLHLLINNAGVAGARGVTRSGFELAFGTNHMGHFLLTSLLLERLRASAPARIVTVASMAHYKAPPFDEGRLRGRTRSLTGLAEYQTSKLANVLFSAELARRLEGSGVTTYALHPGVVATEIWRGVPWPIRPLITARMIDAETGARTSLHCALSREAGGESGLYYDRSAPVTPSAQAQDRALAERLWRLSEAWIADGAAANAA